MITDRIGLHSVLLPLLIIFIIIIIMITITITIMIIITQNPSRKLNKCFTYDSVTTAATVAVVPMVATATPA